MIAKSKASLTMGKQGEKFDDFDVIIEEYKNALEESAKEISNLTTLLQEEQQITAALERDRNEMIDQSRNEIEELEESIIHLDNECEYIKNGLHEKQAECDELNERCNELCQIISQREVSCEDMEETLRARISTLEKENIELRRDAADMSIKYDILKRKYDATIVNMKFSNPYLRMRENDPSVCGRNMSCNNFRSKTSDISTNSPLPENGHGMTSRCGNIDSSQPSDGTGVDDSNMLDWKIAMGIDNSDDKCLPILDRSRGCEGSFYRRKLSRSSIEWGCNIEETETHPYHPHSPTASSSWQSSVFGTNGKHTFLNTDDEAAETTVHDTSILESYNSGNSKVSSPAASCTSNSSDPRRGYVDTTGKVLRDDNCIKSANHANVSRR